MPNGDVHNLRHALLLFKNLLNSLPSNSNHLVALKCPHSDEKFRGRFTYDPRMVTYNNGFGENLNDSIIILAVKLVRVVRAILNLLT